MQGVQRSSRCRCGRRKTSNLIGFGVLHLKRSVKLWSSLHHSPRLQPPQPVVLRRHATISASMLCRQKDVIDYSSKVACQMVLPLRRRVCLPSAKSLVRPPHDDAHIFSNPLQLGELRWRSTKKTTSPNRSSSAQNYPPIIRCSNSLRRHVNRILVHL